MNKKDFSADIMAKEPRAKHIYLDQKPWTIKIFASEHFPGLITNTSKFANVMEAIKRKLTK